MKLFLPAYHSQAVCIILFIFQIIIRQKKSTYSNATDIFVGPALCNDNSV